MSELLIYTEVCLPCKFGREHRIISFFAKDNNLKVKVRRTKLNSRWADEAEMIADIDLPYVYNPDSQAAVALRNITEEKLHELL